MLLPHIVEFNANINKHSRSQQEYLPAVKRYANISHILGLSNYNKVMSVRSLVNWIQFMQKEMNIPLTIKEMGTISAVSYTHLDVYKRQCLGHALALYTYESDVVGLLVSATEPYCLFPPCITCMANREVIGIVTKIHNPDANVKLATSWLELAGCKKIFYVRCV